MLKKINQTDASLAPNQPTFIHNLFEFNKQKKDSDQLLIAV